MNERQKLKEGQSRIDPDPSKRQHKPQRQYDPEVNRRVQLNKYEIQSEIEKKNADENLNNIKNRKIGEKDQQYYEARKQRIMNDANKIKKDADSFNDNLASNQEVDSLVKMPVSDPYQVKSYGAPTTLLKEKLDAQKEQENNLNSNHLEPNSNREFNGFGGENSPNSSSFSAGKSSGRKKKKKRKKKITNISYNSQTKSINNDNISNLNSQKANLPLNIQTHNSSSGFGESSYNTSRAQPPMVNHPGNAPDFGKPMQPPQNLMTPQKTPPKLNDDPFAGIGFGGGLIGSTFDINPTQNLGPTPKKLSLFHIDEVPTKNPVPVASHPQKFNDPFSEEVFFPEFNENKPHTNQTNSNNPGLGGISEGSLINNAIGNTQPQNLEK